MTTLSEKDERLARQADEIESLNRKVESLERELAKCLDPDSGEINPSIRYHYKTGEGALLEKIQTLEKQLTDCLEDSPETIRFRTDIDHSRQLEAFILNVGASVFQPVKYYDEENPGHGKITEGKWGVWSRLVYCLIDQPEFADLWANQAFRDGVNLINEVVGFLQKAHLKPETATDEYEMAAEYLCFANAEDHQGIIALRSALERLYHVKFEDYNEFPKEEIDYMIFALQIVIQLQRLYLTMDMNRK